MGLGFSAGLLRNLFSFAMVNDSSLVVLQKEQGRRFTFSVCYCLHRDKNNSWLKYCLFLCIDVLRAPPMSVPLPRFLCIHFVLPVDQTTGMELLRIPWRYSQHRCQCMWCGQRGINEHSQNCFNSSDSADGKVFTVAEVICAALH